MTDWVRPTRRCLEQLSIPVPNLGVLLHELEHPLVMKAQQVPEQHRSRAAERILSITDRVWFKVKTRDWRGAAGELERVAPSLDQTWWLTAAGRRADDSRQHDFYSRLSAELHRKGKNTCDSSPLSPSDWDVARLEAEAATKAARLVRHLTRTAACESLRNGDIRGFEIAGHDIRVRLSIHRDGEAYVAIGSTGGADAALLTTVLSAIPGLTEPDWMLEPSETLGLTTMPGEIMWSAMISAEHQEELLLWADEHS